MSSVQDLLDEMSDYGFTDISVTRKLSKINGTVKDICSREPWRFLEAEATLSFDGTNPYPTNTPTDFKAMLTANRGSDGQPLDPIRYDALRRRHPTEINTIDAPVGYYFLGKQPRFWYVPGAAETVNISYLRTHPTLVQGSLETDILIPPEHHEAILFGSLYKLYDMDDDFDIAQRFQQEYEGRIITMRNELWVVQYDRPEQIYVLDDHDLEFLY